MDGRAVVTMKIRRKYTPIYKDATALLRPKTGLNDMIIELDPGHEERRARRRRAGRSRSARRCRTSTSTRSSRRSTPTRATTCSCWSAARPRASAGRATACRPTLQRFEPTGRDLARINGALAERQRNIRRSIHNFRLLAEALGDKDDELAALVDSSNARLPAFADQDARLREALQAAAGHAADDRTRRWPRPTGSADVLGPTLGALRPGARALGPSLRRRAPVPRRDDAGHPRPAAAVRARRRCRRSRTCARRRATSRPSRPS